MGGPGFLKKVKTFFNRLGRGVKTGIEWGTKAYKKIAPKVADLANKFAPVIDLIPYGKEIRQGIDGSVKIGEKIASTVENVLDQIPIQSYTTEEFQQALQRRPKGWN